jgi:AcrR family transcriptional regulator
MRNRKREEIINAAIDLFSKDGVPNVSIEMIAEAANLTRTNIYYYVEGGKLPGLYLLIMAMLIK